MNDSGSELEFKFEYFESADEDDDVIVVEEPDIELKFEYIDEDDDQPTVISVDSSSSDDEVAKGVSRRAHCVFNYKVRLVDINDVGVSAGQISRDLKKALDKHNITRTLFSKAFFNKESSYLKHYLYRLKSWDAIQCDNVKLNVLRLHKWLTDKNGVKKLRKWEKENVLNNMIEESEELKVLKAIELTESKCEIHNRTKGKSLKSLCEFMESEKVDNETILKALFGFNYNRYDKFLNDDDDGLIEEIIDRDEKEFFKKVCWFLSDREKVWKMHEWLKREQKFHLRMGNLYDYYTRKLNRYLKNDPKRIQKDVSTDDISKRVLYVIAKHNLSQTVVSVLVLRSNRCLSKMLNEAKPWSKLHPITEHRYRLLYMWLKDEENGVRNILKLKKRDDNSQSVVSKSINKNWFKQFQAVRVTSAQRAMLNESFNASKFPDTEEYKKLSEKCKLSIIKVRQYFAAQRAKPCKR